MLDASARRIAGRGLAVHSSAMIIELLREIETLTADKQRDNGCPEGVGVTEVEEDELRRVYTVEDQAATVARG